TELPHYGHADRRRAAGPRRYADPRPYRRQVPRRQSGLVRPMRLRASRGFTLPELLIVVTVMAVMVAIGVPSFAEFIRNQRVKTASFEVFASLVFARSEAITRNTSVTLTPSGANWANGWTVTYVDT